MAFLRTQPGDMIDVPAYNKDGRVGFVIARHIDFISNVALFEVFSKFYEMPPSSLEDVDTSERLFRPIMIILSFGKNQIPTEHKWRVLFKDPAYHRDQSNYNQIQIGNPNDCELWEGGKERLVTLEEVLKAEGPIWWNPAHVSVRATAHLNGIFSPNENYSAWKLAGVQESAENRLKMTKINDVKREQASKACQIVAERLKVWATERKKVQTRKKSVAPK